MSSSNTNLLAQLGLFPNSTWCSHGCPVENNGDYPYSVTTMLILERIWSNLCGNCDPESIAITAFEEVFVKPEVRAPVDANLVKSCVMIGTDVLPISNGKYIGAKVANHLASVILYMEFQLEKWRREDEKVAPPNILEYMEEAVNLDCPRNIVGFYDARTPCLCLNQMKEQHKERMGMCLNPVCEEYCLDAKLLTCSGCKLIKYCSKKCQKANWPDHKDFCKELQKKKPVSP